MAAPAPADPGGAHRPARARPRPLGRHLRRPLQGGEPHRRDRLSHRPDIGVGRLRLRPLDGHPLALRGRHPAHRDGPDPAGLAPPPARTHPGGRHRPPAPGPPARRVRGPGPSGRIGLDRRAARLPGGGAGDRAAPPAAGGAPRARRAGLEQHGAPDGDGADGPPAGLGPALPRHHHSGGHRRGAVGARPVRAARRGGSGGLPRRLPPELRRHHLAAALGPVRLRRRRGPRGRAHQPRAPPDHLGDGPLPAHPGGAPGGAAPLAAVGLVPPGGRRGGRDGAQPARRGHRCGAQGGAPGRVPAGRLAPPGPAAGRAGSAAHGAPVAGPLQGPPQLPLPLGRPRRGPCRLRDRAHQPDDDVGAPGEDAERPPRAGAAAAPARAGDRPRGRGRQAGEGRVPGP